ncbi:MAG: hypothetical protein DMF61_22785 [Blastocatellia bacterium AA13]|nr:MAG: hypothetical protein DMF61_22785 [Blastocatellia bacterium AA13]
MSGFPFQGDLSEMFAIHRTATMNRSLSVQSNPAYDGAESTIAAQSNDSIEYGLWGGLTPKELGRRVWHEIGDDNCTGRAAELAFFFTLALFPFLIFLISLLSFIPGSNDVILDNLARVIPHEAMRAVDQWIRSVFGNGSKGLLSFSLLFSIWSASTGTAALIEVLNTAYDVTENRSFLKSQLVAISLTVALSLLIAGGAMLITLGNKTAPWIALSLRLGNSLTVIWTIATWFFGAAMLLIGIAVIYYFGPNMAQTWARIVPGAGFAVAGCIVVSYLFSIYLKVAPSYDATYGGLGAVTVLMLWLYLMSLMIIIGGEINSEIDHALDQPKNIQAPTLD